MGAAPEANRTVCKSAIIWNRNSKMRPFAGDRRRADARRRAKVERPTRRDDAQNSSVLTQRKASIGRSGRPSSQIERKSMMFSTVLFLLSNLIVTCFGWQGLPTTTLSSTSTSLLAYQKSDRNDDGEMTEQSIRDRRRRRREGPWIAVLTEPDACDSESRMEETFSALRSALSSRCIDLVSIRVSFASSSDNVSTQQARLVSLVQRVKSLKGQDELDFVLVVNDNIDAAIDGGADGVHVKEKDASSIPSVREKFTTKSGRSSCIIGTSCHSTESALLSKSYGPDYFFVGTCYLTKSHPEKTAIDMLEGPELPGKVKRVLEMQNPPIIFAIGGIDETNAKEPIMLGADGVAAIRSILCASDPANVAKAINKC